MWHWGDKTLAFYILVSFIFLWMGVVWKNGLRGWWGSCFMSVMALVLRLRQDHVLLTFCRVMCVALNWKFSCSQSRQYSDWSAVHLQPEVTVVFALAWHFESVSFSKPSSEFRNVFTHTHSMSIQLGGCDAKHCHAVETGYWSVVAWWSFLAIIIMTVMASAALVFMF